jgi:hypothetical protein
MALLNEDERRLRDAERETTSSATRARAASALADKTALEMKSTLDDERQLDSQMREQLMPRLVTEAQARQLIEKAKPFSGTQFDISAYQDPDSLNLALQLALVLRNAGWKWLSLNTIQSLGYPNQPRIGPYFGRGLQVSACESDVQNFNGAAGALIQSLRSVGLMMSGHQMPDKQMQLQLLACKILHVQVGSR